MILTDIIIDSTNEHFLYAGIILSVLYNLVHLKVNKFGVSMSNKIFHLKWFK